MFPFLIVTGLFTLFIGVVLLLNYSVLDGMIAAGLATWTAFILFGHLAHTGYLITVMIYYSLGSLFSLYRAGKKQESAFLVMGLLYGGLAVWAAALYF